MSDDLTEYQQRRLELEEEKVEILHALRKDLKHQRTMDNIHKSIEELGIDKDDVITFVKFVIDKVQGRSGSSDSSKSSKKGSGGTTTASPSSEITSAISNAVNDAMSKYNVSVKVETDEED